MDNESKLLTFFYVKVIMVVERGSKVVHEQDTDIIMGIVGQSPPVTIYIRLRIKA